MSVLMIAPVDIFRNRVASCLIPIFAATVVMIPSGREGHEDYGREDRQDLWRSSP